MRHYRSDGQLEHYAMLEWAIEKNDAQRLNTLVGATIRDLGDGNLVEVLVVEAIELCLLFARPNCLAVMLNYGAGANVSLQSNQTQEHLSAVALLSTSCQDDDVALGDVFACLLQLHQYDANLLTEMAGEQFDEPYNTIPACVFLAIQVLHHFDEMTDDELIEHFSQCPLQALISQGATNAPTLVHYIAMHGRAQLMGWLIEQMRVQCPEDMLHVLSREADFGAECGLTSTPLICAITAESLDTVHVLLKQNVPINDKARVKKRIVANKPPLLANRCLDRQRRMADDAAKTPNEVATSIKDKKTRVSIKALLRKQQDNSKTRLKITVKSSGDGGGGGSRYRQVTAKAQYNN